MKMFTPFLVSALFLWCLSFVAMAGLSAQIVARFLKDDELRTDSESLADSVLSAFMPVV